ncbi:hypothetical protein VKT23_019932 [Stygiomarasmius scandens]|uniref:2OGFeDO JBP1/TET oxygenase domain-containing protein n=1 Tax=Marasmiellus scandens TaxID=2682957 RepID=A0ABR1ILK3_9AGAR
MDLVEGVKLDRISNALRKAINHKVVLPIKAEDYFSLPLQKRYKALSKWRNDSRRNFSENTVFVDEDGISLIWYLPNLLENGTKNRVFDSTGLIDRKLVLAIHEHTNKDAPNNKNWRGADNLFDTRLKRRVIRPGVANFSFGWRGCGKGWTDDVVKSSLSLKEPASEVVSTQLWLERITDLQVIISLILSIIHPVLFDAAKEVLDYCVKPSSHDGETFEWASRWNSVFTALTVISDRITPEHVDSRGSPRYFDALVSLGTATSPKIAFKELDSTFSYKAGTIIFFAGRGWTHEVGDWGSGARVCYASYIRREMIEGHGETVDSWGLRL